MTDPRFHQRAGPFTLAQLADLAGGTLTGGQGAREIGDIAPLDLAGPGELSFLDNTGYLPQFEVTGAGACIVHPKHAERAPAGVALIVSEAPYQSFAKVAQAFYPRPRPSPGIGSGAVVDREARIADGVEIGPNAVVMAGAKIGENSYIGPGTVIERNVEIGASAIVHANVTVSHALIGDRVTLHTGVRVGQDGFGFAPDPAGHRKVPQIGRVIVGDDCDIGANTTIDRGSLQDTVIGDGCWLDNLVQIAHNVELGRGTIIAAQTGIAGSTKIGNFVAIGGQVAIAGHLNLGDGVQLAAKSGVMADVPPGLTLCGSPAVPIKEFFRQVATLKKLASQRGR